MADGKSLIVQGQTVTVWDMETGKRRSSWSLLDQKVLKRPADGEKSSEGIISIAASSDGNKIAFGVRKDKETKDLNTPFFHRLSVFETTTGKLLHQWDSAASWYPSFANICFSPDGKRLAADIQGNGQVYVWNVGIEKPAWQFDVHLGSVTSLAFSPDGKRLASASEDSTVLVWDLAK
jgi:WD40 repeat protein